MKLNEVDIPDIIEAMEKIAQGNNYTKIFIKLPESLSEPFIGYGYVIEAKIPFFYNGKEKGFFMAKYLDPSRLKLDHQKREEITRNIRIAKSQQIMKSIPENHNYNFRLLKKEDANELSELYKIVFKSYPFPIHDPEYIKKTMDENIIYFGAMHNDKLVAASSSEMNIDNANVEMTDFATNPKYRGNKLALILLDIMEKEMSNRNMKTFYTIARSHSAGMNITFARKRYKFAGTLFNNTNIAGSIESMNVWYK